MALESGIDPQGATGKQSEQFAQPISIYWTGAVFTSDLFSYNPK